MTSERGSGIDAQPEEESNTGDVLQEPRSSIAFIEEIDGDDLRSNDGNDEDRDFDVPIIEADQAAVEIPLTNKGHTNDSNPEKSEENVETVEEVTNQEPKVEAPILDIKNEASEERVSEVVPAEKPKEDHKAEEKSQSGENVSPPEDVLSPPVESEDQEEAEINFTVKTPAGKKYALKMDPYSTVEEIKETLAKMDEQDLEAKEIKLIFRGKPLNSATKTLKDIGVLPDMTVYMIRQLYGPSSNTSTQPSIQKSTESQRGFITITIPQGARPGNRLIIHPPRRQRMVVYVPRGMGPGDSLRVQLPDAPGSSARQVNNAPANSGRGNQAVNPSQALQNPNINHNTVLKATCPADGRPGQELRINIQGVGVLKVTIPASVRPGEPFYFRVPPL